MWWWRLWAGFRIVPTAVKLRVGVVSGLVALGLSVLALALPGWPPAAVLRPVGVPLLLGLGLVVGYALWCLLPALQLGIAPSLRGDLPCPPGQRVRLSFDDGPTPGLTDAVLDLLQRHGVQATFFLLAQKARRHPDLVRRIVAEGHLVGLHGEDHRLVLRQSAATLAQRLGRARADLHRLSGQPITLYRPSHGFKNWALLRALGRLDLKLVFWDFGVWDTDAPPPAVLLARLRLATPDALLERPPILLLHDGRGDEPDLPPHHRSLLVALSAWLPSARKTASRREHGL